MAPVFDYRHLHVAPGSWPVIRKGLDDVRGAVTDMGGTFYGFWTGVIGLPSDQAIAMTHWPTRQAASSSDGAWARELAGVRHSVGELIVPTVRPTSFDPPSQQGIYAHRWFSFAEKDWEEFLSLSETAWPAFESAFEARIIGFFRALEAPPEEGRALLLTWYASLAAWEKSRDARPESGAAEAWTRFVRRHELTLSTNVVATELAGFAGIAAGNRQAGAD